MAKLECDVCGTTEGDIRQMVGGHMCRACWDELPPFPFDELPSPYREELTPAGLQLCIPGTERIPPKTGKPAQLSLFP